VSQSAENRPLAPVGNRVAAWIATGLGVGHVPVAPGTVGSLLGLPLAWGIGQIPSPWLAAVAIIALGAVGIPIVNAALPRLGRLKDPGCVVYDEIVGVTITFFLVPITSWKIAVLGFALFRLFDVTKPPPARQLEKLPGGLGVMADDWMAGIYACLALHGCLYLFPILTG
jgi:phosphatidylglycerophosphatase A